jgi:hypothetical protein
MYEIKNKYNRIRGEQQLQPTDNSILFHCFRNESPYGAWIIGLKQI